MELSIKPIGTIHSCYREKFGIPRQPGLVKSARGSIELLPPCDREEMFKELERFSHIWVQFLFHEAVPDGWRPTVRPPWLGGQKRVGLFASRTPHRPNFLGLSVVRYHGLRREKGSLYLDISEQDLLHGTPVFDLKPYVPYSDAVPDASSGFAHFSTRKVAVAFSREAEEKCRSYQEQTDRNLLALVTEILTQDPRPASQRASTREYGMLLWDVNIRWKANGEDFMVFAVEQQRE